MAIQKPPFDAGIFGQGIKYPPTLDANGRLRLSWGAKLVEESILSIARTQIGERPMQPDYGANVGLGDLADLGAFRVQLESCIAEHEPRCDSVSITVSDPQTNGTVMAHIKYRIRGEADHRTLTYPLFTGPARTPANE